MKTRRIAVLTLGLSLLSSPLLAQEEEKEGKGPLLYYASLHMADLLSTEVALSRGAEESNPLVKDRLVRIAVKGGATFLMYKGDTALRGHTKTRWAARILVGVGYGVVIRHNMTRGLK